MKNRYQLKSYLLRDSDVFYIMDDIILEDKRVLPHCHDFYEFFFVLEGELLENCNGKNTLLGEKQFHLLEPDDEHLIRQSPNCSKSVLRNIAIDRSFFEARLADFGCSVEQLEKYMTIDSGYFNEIVFQTEMAIKKCAESQVYHFILSNVLDQVLINARFLAESSESIPAWVKKLHREMMLPENYIAGLERMLELVGKSQSHVTRYFRKYYHMTPTGSINLLRLEYAVSLLKTTDKKIVDIAYECGFDSVVYFNKIFKNQYLLTPKAFRDRNIY